MSDDHAGPFGMIPTHAVRDPRLGNAEIRVLADLSTYANTDGWTKVGPSRIAADLGISRQTVAEHLAHLETLGWVEVHRRGPGRYSVYRVLRGAGTASEGPPNLSDHPTGVSDEPTGGVGPPDTEQTNQQTMIPDKTFAPAPRTRDRDPYWDALVHCWNLDETELAPTERGRLNKAAKILRDLGADPAEVGARRAMYAILFPDAAQTPLALVNRWAECRPDPTRIPHRAGRQTGTIARAAARADR